VEHDYKSRSSMTQKEEKDRMITDHISTTKYQPDILLSFDAQFLVYTTMERKGFFMKLQPNVLSNLILSATKLWD